MTDLDYTPLPLVTRSNGEKDFQFTQEVRVASAPAAPIKLSDNATLKWQGGVFLFTQNYDQRRGELFAPFLLSPLLPFSVDQHSPEAALDDGGIGVYGQGTVTFGNRSTLTVGARVDHENKKADLDTFLRAAAFLRRRRVDAEKSFSNVSPQFAFSYHVTPRAMTYVSARPRLQGGRLQSRVAARERRVRRRAHLACRGRCEEPWARTRRRRTWRCSRSTGPICS